MLFELVTGTVIKWAALHTQGAAGPSGVDVYGWSRLCTSFGDASVSLGNSLAALAQCLATETVDPTELMDFVACRFIPLNKQPGVQLIGIGDVPRTIVSKVILYLLTS